MSDETNEVVSTAAKIGTGGLLGWLWKFYFERRLSRADELETKQRQDLEIRLAKLEEQHDNTREKVEERISGVASYWSAKVSALEKEVAELKGAIAQREKS